jgi:hypothetical protein
MEGDTTQVMGPWCLWVQNIGLVNIGHYSVPRGLGGAACEPSLEEPTLPGHQLARPSHSDRQSSSPSWGQRCLGDPVGSLLQFSLEMSRAGWPSPGPGVGLYPWDRELVASDLTPWKVVLPKSVPPAHTAVIHIWGCKEEKGTPASSFTLSCSSVPSAFYSSPPLPPT